MVTPSTGFEACSPTDSGAVGAARYQDCFIGNVLLTNAMIRTDRAEAVSRPPFQRQGAARKTIAAATPVLTATSKRFVIGGLYGRRVKKAEGFG